MCLVPASKSNGLRLPVPPVSKASGGAARGAGRLRPYVVVNVRCLACQDKYRVLLDNATSNLVRCRVNFGGTGGGHSRLVVPAGAAEPRFPYRAPTRRLPRSYNKVGRAASASPHQNPAGSLIVPSARPLRRLEFRQT